MMETRYENADKIYVCVKAVFYADGSLQPVTLVWEDGREYTVDKVLDIRRAASLKAGGTGIRYTCRIAGKETYLFFEEGRWFMERK